MTRDPICDFEGEDVGHQLPLFDASDRRHGEAFNYVLGFGGVVKVGRTKNPRVRIGEHWCFYRDAYGPLWRLWISPAHIGYVEGETALRNFGKARAPFVRRKKDAFVGLDPNEVIAFARTLSHVRAETPVTA